MTTLSVLLWFSLSPIAQAQSQVWYVAFAPSGRTLAVRETDNIILYETATRRERATIVAKSLSSIYFSPDGKYLATVDGKHSVAIWDLQQGRTLTVTSAVVLSNIVFSPDGKTLYAIRGVPKDGTNDTEMQISIWNVLTGKEVGALCDPRESVGVLAISSDGKMLAAGGGRTGIEFGMLKPTSKPYGIIKLWNTDSKKIVCSIEGITQPITCMRFTLGGAVLAAASNDSSADVWAIDPKHTSTIRLWDVRSGKCLHELSNLPGTIHDITISDDGTLMAAAADKAELLVWDLVPKPKLRKVLRHGGLFAPGPSHRSPVPCATFSPDGTRIASICWNSPVGTSMITSLNFWNAQTGEPYLWHIFGRDRKHDILAQDLPSPDALTSEKIHELWIKLKQEDSPAAYRIVRTMVQTPEMAVSFLRREVKPVSHVAPQQVALLIGDLESDEFAVREKARQALECLEEIPLAALEQAMSNMPSAESRRQIKLILEAHERFMQPVPPPERLRLIRALEVLENINNDDARKLVSALAHGEPRAWLTKEAKAVHERMLKRPVSKP